MKNRWWVVPGAILVQLCLGAIYAWSVFTPTLKAAPFSFTAAQTQWVFAVGLLTFAITMILAGRWQAKAGPRIVCITGGLLLGAGYVLAKFFGSAFMGQVICIGLLGGAGIGLAYVCPIAVGIKWFPDKKGMVSGLSVAGFGFGALIWIKLAGSWGHLIETMGILNVFALYGLVFTTLVLIGSTVMVNPPAGYKPEGWEPPVHAENSRGKGTLDFRSGQMLRCPQFYSIWITFTLSAMAGLMVIGCIKLFGIDALQKSGYEFTKASAIAGTAMAVFFAIANGLGRIIWGIVSDKIGRKASIAVMCLSQGVFMLLFFQMGSTPALLYLGAAIIGFNFGGNFSLFPAATSDFFGNKNVGTNYGWVFTAYGIGGLIGPLMAGYIRDSVGNFLYAFIPAGIACLFVALITLIVKAPHKIPEAACCCTTEPERA
jgi:OFA family oxalate/formate antiporter-like MFS transporter